MKPRDAAQQDIEPDSSMRFINADEQSRTSWLCEYILQLYINKLAIR